MEIEKQDWVRIRTNNGEWISEIHAEILTEEELAELECFASEEGKELDKHYGYYDTGEPLVWCYKHDVNKLLSIYNIDLENFRL